MNSGLRERNPTILWWAVLLQNPGKLPRARSAWRRRRAASNMSEERRVSSWVEEEEDEEDEEGRDPHCFLSFSRTSGVMSLVTSNWDPVGGVVGR